MDGYRTKPNLELIFLFGMLPNILGTQAMH